MFYRASGKTNHDLIQSLIENGVLKQGRISEVMGKVDRGKYVDTDPYYDSPQSIGYGVTISAPHMHAMCLDLLSNQLYPGAKVLDVGSGSGYLCSCMGLMVGSSGKVIGIDVIPQLIPRSIENIKSDNPELLENGILTIKLGDGWKGCPEEGPFDAIHVGAAAETLPKALVDQLKPGGRLIIPVGTYSQELLQVDKAQDGTIKETSICGVRYVPLVKNKVL